MGVGRVRRRERLMNSMQKGSISNVIHEGIKRGIEVLLEHGCYRSALILIYAGIDAMAFLSMPVGQQDVKGADFIAWAEKYIHFPSKEQLTGLELYGARCGLLHTYSVISKLSREGKCREVGYVDDSVPEVIYHPEKHADLVMVSVTGLAEAFFRGVDRFIIEAFGDPVRAPLAVERLQTLIHSELY
jgi:hypothetical protein